MHGPPLHHGNGLKDGDEAAYREVVDRLAEWCDANNLLLNTEKTIVDFRRNTDPHIPIHIKETTVEHVTNVTVSSWESTTPRISPGQQDAPSW